MHFFFLDGHDVVGCVVVCEMTVFRVKGGESGGKMGSKEPGLEFNPQPLQEYSSLHTWGTGATKWANRRPFMFIFEQSGHKLTQADDKLTEVFLLQTNWDQNNWIFFPNSSNSDVRPPVAARGFKYVRLLNWFEPGIVACSYIVFIYIFFSHLSFYLSFLWTFNTYSCFC